MISSLAKVVGLHKNGDFGSRHGKVIQYDRNDNISHTSLYRLLILSTDV